MRHVLFVLITALSMGCEPTSKTSPKIDTPKQEEVHTIKMPVGPPDAQREKFEADLLKAYPLNGPKATNTRKFDLRAAPTTVQMFDGQLLNVWAYNGQVPGPILRVRLGEAIEVNFTNDLPQATTIHWHGVRVPNAMDGVPGVTQDPIPPGGKFTYRFTPKDAGTFWFHPHVRGAEQVERGLYGIIIVEDAKPLPYTRDEVWVIDDWRLGADGELDTRFVTRGDLAHDGRWGRKISVNGDARQETRVRPGERMRLRLANTSNARVYKPDFSGLDAKVIAVDGMYTSKAISPAGFELAPGNRLDLDITIPADAKVGSVIPIMDRFSRRRTYTLATLRVEGEPVETPAFKPPFNPNIPKWKGAIDRDVDVTYVLNAKRGGKYGIQWTINGKPWGEHEITEFTAGKWTRIRFQNDSGRLHPMHIHGQFFKVMMRNGKAVDDGYFRDTILMHGRETLDIAMVPIDWGRWLMHCHILEHAEAGMMTEIKVGD